MREEFIREEKRIGMRGEKRLEEKTRGTESDCTWFREGVTAIASLLVNSNH